MNFYFFLKVYVKTIYSTVYTIVGGGLLIKKIKNSRGWILTVTVLGEPREFLIFFESLRKNYLQYCIYSWWWGGY